MTNDRETGLVRAGSVLRRSLRTQLDILVAKGRLTYTENKGLLTSDFVITTDQEIWGRINREIARFNAP